MPSPDKFTWQDAVDYVESLKLGGHDDWRMPSAKELFSISDFSSGWPYLNTTYFKLASSEVTKDEQFWTSHKYVGVTVEGRDDAAFGVNHVTGHIKAYPAGAPPSGQRASAPPQGAPIGKHVRAVRGSAYGVNEFFDYGDGTITDKATGLMWAQADSREAMDWQDALVLAENSQLAGYTDWRLPNVKELQSIVDYLYSPSAPDPAKQRAAIDPLFQSAPITNEAGKADYGYYWTSTSAHFTAGKPYYYAWYVAFGRAVNGEGQDLHGAGAVRFDTKYKGGPVGEGGERYLNVMRLVRDAQ